jgi:hypothetical protein
MIKKFTLAFILLLTAVISNCQTGDEYQIFALKYADGQNISTQRMIASDTIWLLPDCQPASDT